MIFDFIYSGIVAALIAYLHRLMETCTFDSWRKAFVWYKGLTPKSKTYFWWLSEDKDELKDWWNYPWRDGYHTFQFALFGIVCTSIPLYGIFVFTRWIIYEAWYYPPLTFIWLVFIFGITKGAYGIYIKRIIRKWKEAGSPTGDALYGK